MLLLKVRGSLILAQIPAPSVETCNLRLFLCYISEIATRWQWFRMFLLQCQLFGWLHLRGIGSAAGCGCKPASAVLWGMGREAGCGQHTGHILSFFILKAKVLQGTVVLELCLCQLLLAACVQGSGDLLCVLRQSEADENALNLASNSEARVGVFSPFFLSEIR